MSPVPRVCVVIVHGHGCDLLERCLNRLLHSRGIELDVVVVANACDDELPDIVRRRPNVHVVESSEPLSFSAANNLGSQWTRDHLGVPDLYFFLNNDTEIERGAIAALVGALKQNPDWGIAGPRLMILGSDDRLNSLGLNVTEIGEAWDEGIGISLEEYGTLPQTREVLAVTGAALMIRGEVLDQVGGWEDFYDYYYEDIDLCLCARSHGWRVGNVPNAVVWHAVSATAKRDSEFKNRLTWRNRLLILAVHWPWSLLGKVALKLTGSELMQFLRRIRRGAFGDARVQTLAWLGGFRRLPWAVGRRRQSGSETGWISFLHQAGVVPIIELPELLSGLDVESADSESSVG